MNWLRLRLAIFAALLGFIASAQASITYNLIIDPKAAALGNAVTADDVGIFSVQYNPAALTHLKGRQFQFNLFNIALGIEAEFIADEDCEIFNLSCIENDPTANRFSQTSSPALFLPGQGLDGITELPIPLAALPSTAFSINPPGSKFTFANAFFIPLPAGYTRDGDDPARFQARSVALTRITYLSPTLGYEINDEWSVGVGFHFSYQALALDQEVRAPNLLLGVAELLQDAFNCDSGNEPLAPFIAICGGRIGPFREIGGLSLASEQKLSPNFTVGVLWEPNDFFSWGASYQSEAENKLQGEFVLNYSEDWQGFWQGFNASIIGAISSAILSLPTGVPQESGNITVDLPYPQRFNTGIRLQLTPHLQVSADANWTDWAVWDGIGIQFDRSLEFLNAARILRPEIATSNSLFIPLNYESVWNFGFGVEIALSDRLVQRFGIEIRDSPIPDSTRDVLAPLNDAILYGAGFGYKWDRRTQIDLSANFIQSREFIPAGTSDNLNATDLTNIVTNPFAGQDVRTRFTIGFVGLSFRRSF